MTQADCRGDVTLLLQQWRSGQAGAESALMGAVHGELRRIAAAHLRRERPGHTLDPAALVNEVYVRLVRQRRLDWQNRAHFFSIVARMMRRTLVDHARRRRTAKREGFAGDPVSLSGVADPMGPVSIDVLALHDALSELARFDARQSDIVEQRFFGGLSIEDIASVQGLSERTVKRELTIAKLWLRRKLQGSSAV